MLFLVCVSISLLIGYLILRFNGLHAHVSIDHVDSGPQKFHSFPTPRIGGIALAVSLICGYGYVVWTNTDGAGDFLRLLLAGIPAFLGGLVEDVTKRVSVRWRLVLTMVSAGLAALLLGAVLHRSGVPWFDYALRLEIFAVFFTLFAVGGVANAINIIDGFNGLVSGYAALVLAAFSWVSWLVGDHFLLDSSLAMLGAVIGFHLWNYPNGRIFLGDGGAYLLGFWLAELSVLMLARHPDVTPWFVLLLLAYPVSETLFTIYRRVILHDRAPWEPDGLHLHTLIFRRLNRIKWASDGPHHRTSCNSMTAPYLWAVNAFAVVPATLFWDNPMLLVSLTLLFVATYLWLYWTIVTFRTPRWLIRHDRRDSRAPDCRRDVHMTYHQFVSSGRPSLRRERRKKPGRRRTDRENT